MLYNRSELIRDLQQLGYVVVDEWRAPELSMEIPGYPEHKIWAYSGIFLRYEGKEEKLQGEYSPSRHS
jgi:hypothetical protein